MEFNRTDIFVAAFTVKVTSSKSKRNKADIKTSVFDWVTLPGNRDHCYQSFMAGVSNSPRHVAGARVGAASA